MTTALQLLAALALGALSPLTARAAACGDGVQDAGESCDDGNVVDGDGCSATCQVECDDSDGDGWCDASDNCPSVANPFQIDTDADGEGDACDVSCQDVVDDGDSYIDSTHPGTNFGGLQTMIVQSSPDQQALIHFDLGPLPANAIIVGGTLDVLQRDTDHSVDLKELNVRTVKNPWSEATVTWSNYNGGQPNTGVLLGTTMTIGAPLYRGHMPITLSGRVLRSTFERGLCIDQFDGANQSSTTLRAREPPVDDRPLLNVCYLSCSDVDQDGVCDDGDNCTFAYNPGQHDSDGDGAGDACDPACESLSIDADTYIDKSTPNVNYGVLKTMNVSALPIREMLLHFDLSPVPAGAQITSGTLDILQRNTAIGVQTKTLTVRTAQNPFNELTTTWANYAGGAANTGLLLGSASTIGAPLYRGHVLIALSGAMTKANVSNGLVVDQLASANMNATVFRSREPPVDDEPKLKLCWIVPE
jgi:cysteine-rich repeat protein